MYFFFGKLLYLDKVNKEFCNKLYLLLSKILIECSKLKTIY